MHSGALWPRNRHLQPPPARLRRRAHHLPLEDYAHGSKHRVKPSTHGSSCAASSSMCCSRGSCASATMACSRTASDPAASPSLAPCCPTPARGHRLLPGPPTSLHPLRGTALVAEVLCASAAGSLPRRSTRHDARSQAGLSTCSPHACPDVCPKPLHRSLVDCAASEPEESALCRQSCET
jgi:hypothetical protein